MREQETPTLSQLFDAARIAPESGESQDDPGILVLGGRGNSADRRTFIRRASALSLAIPGAAASLVACNPPQQGREQPAGTDEPLLNNANSRLDSALAHPSPQDAAGGVAAQDAANVPFVRYAPELPPLPQGGTQQLNWRARHVPLRIDPSTVIVGWTFEGNVPGPIVHTRVGDTVEFTLTNDEDVPHSMDFHAAQIDPKVAFRSIPRNQSVSFTFRPRFAGAFMYHCGTAPVLMHIGAGMYGAIIVSPREPLPAAREFVLVQSEYYLADAVSGVRAPDYGKMLETFPDYVCFNGRPNQYVTEPIRVRTGERVRFWVVNAGPTHASNFHVVGEQFDTMYLGAPPDSPVRGVQTWGVPPGGGMVFELVCDVAGEFPFVNHGFGHGQKGGVGFLVVE